MEKLFERQREKERDGEIEKGTEIYLLSAGSLPISQDWARLKSGAGNSSASLTCMAECHYPSHHLPASRVAICKKLDQKQDKNLDPDTDTGCKHLNSYTKCLLPDFILFRDLFLFEKVIEKKDERHTERDPPSAGLLPTWSQ